MKIFRCLAWIAWLVPAQVAWCQDAARHMLNGRYMCNEDVPGCRYGNAQQEQIDRMRESREMMQRQRERQDTINPPYPPQGSPVAPNKPDSRRNMPVYPLQ